MILFYDGTCPLCHFFVRLILNSDRKKTLLFAPLQGKTALGLSLSGAAGLPDSVILLQDGQVYTASSAIFRIFRYLGRGWLFLSVFRILPVRFTDYLYRVIARNRTAWFGRYPECRLPQENEAHRFLD